MSSSPYIVPKFVPRGGVSSGVQFKEIKRSPVPLLNPALVKPPFREKPHISTWFFTLNTNKGTKRADFDAYQFGVMLHVLECLFDDPENLLHFMNVRQDGQRFPENIGKLITPQMLLNKELFPDIPGKPNSNRKISHVKEIGSNRRRMHLHAKFSIIHYTILSIDPDRLKERAEYCLRSMRALAPNVDAPNSIYINSRFVRNDKFMVGNYIANWGGLQNGWDDVFDAIDDIDLNQAKDFETQRFPKIEADEMSKKILKDMSKKRQKQKKSDAN